MQHTFTEISAYDCLSGGTCIIYSYHLQGPLLRRLFSGYLAKISWLNSQKNFWLFSQEILATISDFKFLSLFQISAYILHKEWKKNAINRGSEAFALA